MKFPESKIAHHYLDGLLGIEIGAAAHNPFGLNTRNVDRFDNKDPRYAPYAQEQMRLCGEESQVDIVAPADKLTMFPDKSVDFVVSSHVLEHCWDPIATVKEWKRVARKYILIIIPHRDALPSDREKPITLLTEQAHRTLGVIPPLDTDDHHTRWTVDSFLGTLQLSGIPTYMVKSWEQDDKVGNGHMFLITL